MHPHEQAFQSARRKFLTSTSSGLGLASLRCYAATTCWLAKRRTAKASIHSLPSSPIILPRRRCVFILPEGAAVSTCSIPSRSCRNNMASSCRLRSPRRFALRFLKKETAVLWGSKRKFAKHGNCGMELSDYLPHLGKCADDIGESSVRCIPMRSIIIRLS